MHGQPHTGGAEGVTNAQAAAPQVELVHVDISDLLLEPHHIGGELVAAHGLDVGKDLTGKSLVIFQDGDVTELELHHVKDLGCGVGRSEEELVLGVLGHVGEGAEVGLGGESELLGLLLGHNEAGRGAVSQVGGVSGGHGAVGLDEGGLELGHLLLTGNPDAVIKTHEVLAFGNFNGNNVGQVARLLGLLCVCMRASKEKKT